MYEAKNFQSEIKFCADKKRNTTMASGLHFEKEEKILCFHGPLLYEAKILKAEYWDAATFGSESGPHYFVHYRGWKQSWDEWVPETRILKFDDDGLKRQAELLTVYRVGKDEKSAAAGTRDKRATDSHSAQIGRKRVREGATDKEDDYNRRAEIRIPLSEAFKAQLVDDWENVTKSRRLVSLPRSPTVAEILRDFKKHRLENNGPRTVDEDSLDEVLDGLKLYFDKALGTILLYRQERQQYADAMKRYPDKCAHELYGAEHLLRLFVQLPMLIVHTSMDANSIVLLKEHLNHILIFMQKHSKDMFLAEYDNAPPEYYM